jgi:superfamily II DNA/RNA helicase
LILVATPPALVSIMENPEQAIDFKELPHFVIDEFSQITESFQDDLIKIKGYGWLHNKNCQVIIDYRLILILN